MQIPAWHTLETDKVLHRLRSDRNRGLTPEEVGKRLAEFGPNELRKEERASPFSLFLSQFKNLLIVILLAATVLREAKEEEIPSRDLVPGDIVLLEAGDKIPADGRLVEVRSLNCDEAALTGESVPVRKAAAALGEQISIGERLNMVFAGTIVTYGRGKAAVTSTGMNTEFGRIAEEVAAAERKKTPLEKRNHEIGRWPAVCIRWPRGTPWYGRCLPWKRSAAPRSSAPTRPAR